MSNPKSPQTSIEVLLLALCNEIDTYRSHLSELDGLSNKIEEDLPENDAKECVIGHGYKSGYLNDLNNSISTFNSLNKKVAYIIDRLKQMV